MPTSGEMGINGTSPVPPTIERRRRMPTFNVDIDFSVYCSKCGAGLCSNCSTDDKRMKMDIEPCEKCMQDKYDEGYDNGKEAADGED